MRANTAAVLAREEAVRQAHAMDEGLRGDLQPEIVAADGKGTTAMASAAQLHHAQVIADGVHGDLQAQITALTQVIVNGLDSNAQNDAATRAELEQRILDGDARVRAEFQALLDSVREHFEAQLAVVHDELEQPQYVVGSVTSLPAGSAPTVVITGTEAPYALEFGIPQGAAGQTGAQGATGPAGTNAAGGITRLALGVGRIGLALLLGQSVDVVVQLSRPMATTGYQVTIPPQAGWTFGTPKAKTLTSVTIPVTAALALALGATFVLEAYE